MLFQAKIDLQWFKKCLKNKKLINHLKSVKLIVCDVDGTLTNATIYFDQNGEGGRFFSTQDGYITRFIINQGVHLALISGKLNLSTQKRGAALGIPEDMCIGGMCEGKSESIKKLQEKNNITPKETVIFGDDCLDADVKVKKTAHFFICPDNTPFYLQSFADLIIPRHGGNNAFRLFIDLLLFIHQAHPAQKLINL